MDYSSITYNSPCAACKFLRRKCMPSCIFAPYFPPEEPQKFANVHKIFGASNVTKLLNDLQPHQRDDAVNSLAYEAEARVRDPVYGCVGAITFLQRQIDRLQKELDTASAELIRYACNEIPEGFPLGPHLSSIQPITPPQRATDSYSTRRMGTSDGGGYYNQSTSGFASPSYANHLQWNPSSSGGNFDGAGCGG